MLAKLTSKNQLTLPKAVLAQCPKTDYFEVTEENGRIVLTPVRVNRADAVRAKLAEVGLDEAMLADAVAWARGANPPRKTAPGRTGPTRKKPAD